MSCNFCQRDDFHTANARRSHQSRCPRNPKNIVADQQQEQHVAVQEQDTEQDTEHDEERVQFDDDDPQQEANYEESDSDYFDEPELQQQQEPQQVIQQSQPVPVQQVIQQPQQQPARLNLRAIHSGVPTVQTIVKKRGKKGKIESLCDEVVKLANSVRSNDEVFNNDCADREGREFQAG
mmetsp:Transcript_33233/g.65974  ORF Transcript_33233/g.65974 Transcript_33233/m.65974 type:complete len:179 (-) Transcript_33233:456-992(-)